MTNPQEILDQANHLLSQNKLIEALSLYETASQYPDVMGEALTKMGMIQFKLKAYDDAIVSYNRAIEVMPDNTTLMNNLGVLLYKIEKYQDAEQILSRAIQTNTDYFDAKFNLAKVFTVQENWQSAINTYIACLRLQPDHAQSKDALEEVRKKIGGNQYLNETIHYPKELNFNKVADSQDMNQLAIQAIVEKLVRTQIRLDETGLPYAAHMFGSWLKYWECARAVLYSGVDARMRILDAGGTGTVLSYYLAIEGCDVSTVDILDFKARDAKLMSEQLGLNMHHSTQSISQLNFEDNSFDRVFCICVLEHVPFIEQAMALSEIIRVLKPGGVLTLTFDYGKLSFDGDNNAGIRNAQEVYDRIILPSNLKVLGNTLFDSAPTDYGNVDPEKTFASVFLYKEGQLDLEKDNNINLNISIDSSWMGKNPIYKFKHKGRGGKLIISNHGFSDTMMLVPSLREMKRKYSNIRIGLICPGQFCNEKILSECGFIDQIYEGIGSVNELNELAQEIAIRDQYDEVYLITLKHNYREHTIQRIARELDLSYSDWTMTIPVNQELLSDAGEIFDTLGISEDGVNIFFNFKDHQNRLMEWETSEIDFFLDTLKSRYKANIIWYESNTKNGINYTNNDKSFIYNLNVKLNTMSVDYSLLAAIISKCRLFVGIDSYPLICAATTRTPSIALNKTSWMHRTFPLSTQIKIVCSVKAWDMGEYNFKENLRSQLILDDFMGESIRAETVIRVVQDLI